MQSQNDSTKKKFKNFEVAVAFFDVFLLRFSEFYLPRLVDDIINSLKECGPQEKASELTNNSKFKAISSIELQIFYLSLIMFFLEQNDVDVELSMRIYEHIRDELIVKFFKCANLDHICNYSIERINEKALNYRDSIVKMIVNKKFDVFIDKDVLISAFEAYESKITTNFILYYSLSGLFIFGGYLLCPLDFLFDNRSKILDIDHDIFLEILNDSAVYDQYMIFLDRLQKRTDKN